MTAEADKSRCEGGITYLRTMGLDEYVEVKCEFQCPDDYEGIGTYAGLFDNVVWSPEQEDKCVAELRSRYCPNGRLDLYLEDSGFDLIPVSMLRACKPKVLYVSNSGFRDGFMPGDKRVSNWSDYKEDVIHDPAEANQGDWRLAVNKRRSGLTNEQNILRMSMWSRVRNRHYIQKQALRHGAFRRFSVYVAADAELDM
eukprot:gnl/TRDRNA2_/TRDRNA2_146554_c1_seq1.p1 gnl/TRDRNA2_/TRDRNA2_146554_c1~~gnl/TRDRNA2_/TRDRNA2_146554_c1_seq1.p1  ORF type:complete len:217 (+),score=35.12 gnl/TRDRNA2_/TRDRNA2_146554_c1_seq1:59-652(+)